jgi:antirestriction protein ArdC
MSRQRTLVPLDTESRERDNRNTELFDATAEAIAQSSPSCEPATGLVLSKVSTRRRMTMVREDLYQQVTNAIVAELEKGVAPWVRPWKTLDARFGGGPYNGCTDRGYRGVNVWLLQIAAMQRGFEDPRWFTFRQVGLLGGYVKRGEKSTRVIFWKQHGFKETDPQSGVQVEKYVPLLRSYAVFNAEQCVDIAPLPEHEECPTNLRYEQAQELFERHAVSVRFGGDQAGFSRAFDYIQMPPHEAFESEEHFWGTMLHELTHWTGHKSRLDRDLSGRFGSHSYAAEELVAEMGAAFLCANLGISGRLRHPEYIATWLAVLKEDKRAVFKASSLAQAAADFVLGQKVEDSESSDADWSA